MSVEKNQLFKVGDRVKILPTILSAYPNFPYVGVVGRVCVVSGIIFGSILNKSEVLLEFN